MDRQNAWFSRSKLIAGSRSIENHKLERADEMEEVIKLLARLDDDRVKESDQYYPLRFLTDGVAAYFEMFDNAAVYYAGLAVEIGLEIRVWQTKRASGLGDSPATVRRIGAMELVTAAEALQVLSASTAQKAHDLRKLRNSYIHYRNIVKFENQESITAMDAIRQLDAPLNEEIRSKIKDATELQILLSSIGELVEMGEEDSRRQQEIGQLADSEINAESLELLKSRRKAYIAWVESGRSLSGKLSRIGYGAERMDARDSVRWASDVLDEMKFLVPSA